MTNPENVFDLTGLGLTDPAVKDVEVNRMRTGTALEVAKLRIEKQKNLTSEQLGKLQQVLDDLATTQSPTETTTNELLAKAFFDGDEDFLNKLRAEGLQGDDFTDKQYEQAARIILGAPSRRIPSGTNRLGKQLAALQQQMEAGGEAAKQALPPHLQGPDAMIGYQDPWVLAQQEKSGLESWRFMANSHEGYWMPNYYGLPQLTREQLTNPNPEHRRLSRQLRRLFYVNASIARPSMPLRTAAQFAQFAYFGSEGSDTPDLGAKVGEGLQALNQYWEAITRNTEKAADHLVQATPGEMALEAVKDACVIPLVFEYKTQTGELKQDCVFLNPGEIWGIYEGEGLAEPSYDAEGYSIFKDQNGKPRTMKDMTPTERKAALTDPSVRSVYDPGKDPYQFGRKKPGEKEHTETVIVNEKDGLNPIFAAIERQMKDKGISLSQIERFLEVGSDGEPLNRNNEKVQDYIAERNNNQSLAGKKELIEALVAFARVKSAGVQLAEVTQSSWIWDAARLHNATPELADKGMKKWTYNEYYANDPAYWRPFVQPYLNPWPQWKKGNVHWWDVAVSGNPDNISLYARNPVRLDDAPIIMPFKLVDGTPLSELKDKNQLQLILNTIGAVRFEKSPWRTKTFSKMEKANDIVNRAKAGASTEEMFEYARVQFNDYVRGYHAYAPQETMRDPSSRQIVVDGLDRGIRQALAQIDFKPQIAMFENIDPNLPDEEYQGWFGFKRLIHHDSVRWLSLATLEHLYKYTSVYTEMAVAKASSLGTLMRTLVDADDPQLRALLGDVPEQIKGFAPDEAFEGLFKNALNWGFAVMGFRDPKKAMEYVDEYANFFVEKVWPLEGPMGPETFNDIRDILVYSYLFRGKAVDLMWLNIKNSKLGTHGDPTERLEVGGDEKNEDGSRVWDIEKMKAAQVGLEAAGFSLVFHNNADPRDFVDEYVEKGLIPEDQRELYEFSADDNPEEVVQKLERAMLLAKEYGFKFKTPYVRWGMQLQMSIDQKRTPLGKRERRDVNALYGHNKTPEVLWLQGVMNVLQDKMILPNQIVTEIYSTLGIKAEDLEAARKTQKEEAERQFTEAVRLVSERAEQLKALQNSLTGSQATPGSSGVGGGTP